MIDISVTFSVLKTFSAPSLVNIISVKAEQSLNICVILVTLDVLRLETSRLVNELQHVNMYDILVTSSVLKFAKSIDVRLSQLENI